MSLFGELVCGGGRDQFIPLRYCSIANTQGLSDSHIGLEMGQYLRFQHASDYKHA